MRLKENVKDIYKIITMSIGLQKKMFDKMKIEILSAKSSKQKLMVVVVVIWCMIILGCYKILSLEDENIV